MPGLSLTIEQASRLWGVHRSVCETIFQELVANGVLYSTPTGAYVAERPTRQHV